MQTWMARAAGTTEARHPGAGAVSDVIFISARQKQNIDELRELLYTRVRELHVQKYPYNDFLYQEYSPDGEPV